jgi:hypothetical protein
MRITVTSFLSEISTNTYQLENRVVVKGEVLYIGHPAPFPNQAFGYEYI